MPSRWTSMTSNGSWIVDERPVVNASPLIFLARAKRIDLLRVAGHQVVVPDVVVAEITRRGPHDVTAVALESASSWIEIVHPKAIHPVITAWDLGPGESSVLSWAKDHPPTEVIVDDLAARRCAAALGIQARGTLGLILVAKKRGIIHQARPVVESMRQSGMYLSERVMNRALALVDE